MPAVCGTCSVCQLIQCQPDLDKQVSSRQHLLRIGVIHIISTADPTEPCPSALTLAASYGDPAEFIVSMLGSENPFVSFSAAKAVSHVLLDPTLRVLRLQQLLDAAAATELPAHSVAHVNELVVAATRDVAEPVPKAFIAAMRGFVGGLSREALQDKPVEAASALAVLGAHAKILMKTEGNAETLVVLAGLVLQLLRGSHSAGVSAQALRSLKNVVGALLSKSIEEEQVWNAVRGVTEYLLELQIPAGYNAMQDSRQSSSSILGVFLHGTDDGRQQVGQAVGIVADVLVSCCEEPSNTSSAWLKQTLVAGGQLKVDFPRLLMLLYGDDDPKLVHAMRQLLLLWCWCSRNSIARPECSHPHRVFEHFGVTIGFDHTVLLDFLISEETSEFLLYLTMYLKFMQVEEAESKVTHGPWQQQWLQCLAGLEGAMRKLYDKGIFPYNCQPVLRRLRYIVDANSIPISDEGVCSQTNTTVPNESIS